MDRRRGQTSAEYLFIVVSIIMIVALVFLLLRGNLVPTQTESTANNVRSYLNLSQAYLFYDNFDAGNAQRWTPNGGIWGVENREYAQSDASLGGGALSVAGNAGWQNYVAEADYRKSLDQPAGSGFLAGVSVRVDPYALSRYSCMLSQDGNMRLLRFTGTGSHSQLAPAKAVADSSKGTHSIAASASGQVVSCYFDGLLVVSAEDSSLASGAIALDSFVPAAFDNVRVWSIGGALPSFTPPGPAASPSPSPDATIIAAQSACDLLGGGTGQCLGSCSDYADCSAEPDGMCEPGTVCCIGLCGPLPLSAPVISGVSVSQSEIPGDCRVNAEFVWTTDLPSSSTVMLGYTQDTLVPAEFYNYTLTVSHSFNATVLENMPHYYRVISCSDPADPSTCAFYPDESNPPGYFDSLNVPDCSYGYGGSPLLVPSLKALVDCYWGSYDCSLNDPFCY